MKRSRILMIVAGLGVAGLCCLVVCLGILNFSVQVLAEDVRFQLETDPRFVRHVGQVKSFHVNYLASLRNGEDSVFTYDVIGANWSGQLTVKQLMHNDRGPEIVWARFTLPSGEKIELSKKAAEKPDASEEKQPVPVKEEPASPPQSGKAESP